MKIHSSLTFNNIFDVDIQSVDCTYENINATLEMLSFNQVFLTVDSLDKKSEFVQLLDSLQLKYSHFNIDSNMEEISVIIPFKLRGIVLESAIEYDPENIFITNMIEPIEIQKLSKISPENMIQNGFSDATAIVARDKHTIHLCLSSYAYSRKITLKRLREFFLKGN